MPKKKTHEEFVEEVYELVGDEYMFLEDYKNSSTKITVLHNSCNNTYKVTPSNFKSGYRCPHCQKQKSKKTQLEFVKRVVEIHGDVYDFLTNIEGATNYNIPVQMRHKACGYEWCAPASCFVDARKNGRVYCPNCTGHVKYTTDTFKDKVCQLEEDNYIVLGEYVKSDIKIKMKHKACGHEYSVLPTSFLGGARCPNCAGNQRKNTDMFKREVYHLVDDEYTVLGEYTLSKDRIKMRHESCSREFITTPASFLKGIRCAVCSFREMGERRTRTHDEYADEINRLSNNAYNLLSEYINTRCAIKVSHKTCGHTWEIIAQDLRQRLLSGVETCPNCNSKTRFKDTQDFNKELQNLVGNEYLLLSEYIKMSDKIRLLHNIDSCMHEYETTAQSFLKGSRCQKCYGKSRRKTPEDYRKEIEIIGDEYELITDYETALTKVAFLHRDCGNIFTMLPTDFTINNQRCPSCKHVKGGITQRKTHYEFTSEVRSIHGDIFEFLNEYTHSKNQITIKHKHCGYVWDVYPQVLLREQYRTRVYCPCCSPKFYSGEHAITSYLNGSKILFKKEFIYKNLKHVSHLRFDFAILNPKDEVQFLIEYDGEGHFLPIDFAGKGCRWACDQLESNKKRDQIKNNYCRDNNIPLYRIPFWEFNNIEIILDKIISGESLLVEEGSFLVRLDESKIPDHVTLEPKS